MRRSPCDEPHGNFQRVACAVREVCLLLYEALFIGRIRIERPNDAPDGLYRTQLTGLGNSYHHKYEGESEKGKTRHRTLVAHSGVSGCGKDRCCVARLM